MNILEKEAYNILKKQNNILRAKIVYMSSCIDNKNLTIRNLKRHMKHAAKGLNYFVEHEHSTQMGTRKQKYK